MLILRGGGGSEAVLTAQEALVPLLDREGVIASAEFAARLLPSVATQVARIAALPDMTTLAANLEQARDGLPFRPGVFQPFLDAVAASRGMAPLRPENLAGNPIAARLDPLLSQRDGVWQDPVVLASAIRHAWRFCWS